MINIAEDLQVSEVTEWGFKDVVIVVDRDGARELGAVLSPEEVRDLVSHLNKLLASRRKPRPIEEHVFDSSCLKYHGSDSEDIFFTVSIENMPVWMTVEDVAVMAKHFNLIS